MYRVGINYGAGELALARAIADVLSERGTVVGNSGISQPPTIEGEITLSSTQRTAQLFSKSIAGTIPGGFHSITIANIGNSPGQLQGEEILPNTKISWQASGNDTIAEITYDSTNTVFIIAILR